MCVWSDKLTQQLQTQTTVYIDTSSFFRLMFIWEVLEMMLGNSPSLPRDREPSPPISQLNPKAASFVRLFKHHRHRMQQSVESCRTMNERMKQQQYAAFTVLIGFIGLFALVACISLAVADERVLSIGGVIVTMCCFVLFPFFIITEIETVAKRNAVNVSIQDFRRTLSLLNVELEEVKCVCERLRRRLGDPDRVRLMRLEKHILKVFLLTTELTQTLRWRPSTDCVAQVCKEYSKILSELNKIKIQLSFYTGTQ